MQTLNDLKGAAEIVSRHVALLVKDLISYLPRNYDLETQEDANEALWESIDGLEDVIYNWRARLIGTLAGDQELSLEIPNRRDPMHDAALAFAVIYERVQEHPDWHDLMLFLGD